MNKITLSFLLIFLVGCSSGPSISGDIPHFSWPVKKGRLTQEFKSGSKKHEGIDIGGRKNSPIYASAAGVVLYAGRDFSGYGKLIIIEHQGDRWASFYAHLNSFKVKEGSRVRAGQLIGRMGRTGRATGVHLHFEIRYNKTPIDPLEVLSQKVFLSRK